MSVTIREEVSQDIPAIYRVEQAAFTDHPHSNGSEPRIVDLLRDHGDLSLSLVAEDGGEIVGHVAFSPARLNTGEGGWFALGPIAVDPARQGKGIGRALVEAGAGRLRADGASGVVLLGDPALYSRFGFVRGTPLWIEGELADYFQVLAFSADIPAATVSFAPAFAMAYANEA